MTGWALSLHRTQAKALAKLHNIPEVRVGEIGEVVWARGIGTESELEQILTRVPSSRFFEVVHHDRLRPRGRLLPTGRLPDVRWVPLGEWLFIDVPTPSSPGRIESLAELRLVSDYSRSGEELLVCTIDAFRKFVLESPLHRLRPLRFVVSDALSEVLVRGQPLPSIPGERFVLDAGIATPVGRAWAPGVGASVVRSWLGLREGTLAVWRADGGISEVTENDFVQPSRRAGREL